MMFTDRCPKEFTMGETQTQEGKQFAHDHSISRGQSWGVRHAVRPQSPLLTPHRALGSAAGEADWEVPWPGLGASLDPDWVGLGARALFSAPG